MTVAEMKTLLDTTKLPVAYRVFRAPQEPPFIVFYVDGTDNSFADNKVHKTINQWQIDLVTDLKDPNTEALIESVLTHWNKSEVYDGEEKIFIVSYTFEEIE